MVVQEINEKTEVIRLFTEFLKAYAVAPDDERHAFLDFISVQSREDLIHLADALRERHPKDKGEE